MSKKINLIGQKFGRLTVIAEAPNIVLKNGRSYAAWLCKCECGNEKVVRTNALRQGGTSSCGCLAKDVHSKTISKAIRASTKHGDFGTPLYRIWAAMKRRCNNPHSAFYELYGGRGIKVCSEWDEYLPFKEWALNNGYKKGITIDRINCNGNYCPDNCRWISIQEQQRNRRNNRHYEYKGVSYTVKEIADMVGLKPRTIQGRIERGWSVEQVIETPCLRGNGKYYLERCKCNKSQI